MTQNELRYQLSRLSIVEKLIALNVLIFILDGLALGLFGQSVSQWFQLPQALGNFFTRPWSLVTYSFFHYGLGHIFWNMLMLYFAGRIFLTLFNPQHFINVYFLGVLLGGLVFLISYNSFPTLLHTNTALIGASAGVMAVLIFVCAYRPQQPVQLLFFTVKLWQVGVFFVLTDLIQIPYGGNIGGRLAHLGGAFLGYLYAKQLLKGNDIGAAFTAFRQSLAQRFKSKKKKTPLKTVYKKKTTASPSQVPSKQTQQDKIDAILDKISKSGYESLSKAEKDFLFKVGKKE